LEKNSVISAVNLACLSNRVAVTAFDLSRIDVSLGFSVRRARPGEELLLADEPLKLKGKEVILVGSDDKVLSLYTCLQAENTQVTESTRDMLVLALGVRGIPQLSLTSAIDTCKDLFSYCRAAEMTSKLIFKI
jgi:DNA/RNA-binding domain of Phe-tRNA-synthetase-like protein